MNLPASRFELAGKRIEDMEKMTGKSMDLIAENIKQMKALFPEAVTEGKIDFEVLKALLGEEVENGRLIINSPGTARRRPALMHEFRRWVRCVRAWKKVPERTVRPESSTAAISILRETIWKF